MPNQTLNVIFHFAASHFLTKYHGKCENLHGHNYKVIVSITGPVQDDGMVLDFKIIKKVVHGKVIDRIDHTHLNDLLENPSSENLAVWMWNELKGELPLLSKVTIFETEDYYAEYTGA